MYGRVLDLARKGVADEDIAATLTREGHRSPNCESKVLPITVGRIRRGAGIPVTDRRTRWSHDSSRLSPPELAARLNIPVNWIYVQIRQKRLLIDQQPNGAYLFHDTPSVLDAVRNLRKHTVNSIDLSSTFSIFHRLGLQGITQKISSWAMKRSASSIDRTVRPNGPVEAHRSFQSDQ